jgi:hypothetical protein
MAANPAQDWSHQDTHTSHADTVALAIGANPSETGTPVVNQEIGLPELVDLLTRHEERGPNPDDINDPAMKSAKNGPYFCTTILTGSKTAQTQRPRGRFFPIPGTSVTRHIAIDPTTANTAWFCCWIVPWMLRITGRCLTRLKPSCRMSLTTSSITPISLFSFRHAR